MRTRRSLWARGFISSSALLAGLAPAFAGGTPAVALSAAELEIRLARETQLYVVVDAGRQTLAIKARGIVLEELPLDGVALLGYRHPGEEPDPATELPAIRTISDDPVAALRRVISPRELRPYDDAQTTAATPKPGTEETPEAPAAFRVRLDGDWVLHVDEDLPSTRWWARHLGALADGWHRWRGRPPEPRLLLALAMEDDAARRLLYVLRPGLRILVSERER